MNNTPAGLVTASLLQVFGERDAAARLAVSPRILADDVESRDAEGLIHSRAGLEAKVAALLGNAPADWVFQARGAAQELGDLARAS